MEVTESALSALSTATIHTQAKSGRLYFPSFGCLFIFILNMCDPLLLDLRAVKSKMLPNTTALNFPLLEIHFYVTFNEQNNCGPGEGAVYSLSLLKNLHLLQLYECCRVAWFLFWRGAREAGDIKLGAQDNQKPLRHSQSL